MVGTSHCRSHTHSCVYSSRGLGVSPRIGPTIIPNQMEVDVHCAKCGKEQVGSPAFCRACGERLGVPVAKDGVPCLACGRLLKGSPSFCTSCGEPLGRRAPGKTSWAWWLLPILFGCVGGIVAWLAVKEKDKGKAKHLLIRGFLVIPVWVFVCLLSMDHAPGLLLQGLGGVIYCASVLALVAVTYLPPKAHGHGGICVKNSKPLLLPPICVVTGEPATETHLIRFFKGNPYVLEWAGILLPFSETGWRRYSKEFPVSLRLFKAGLNLLRHFPMLGAYFALYVWTPVGGLICGLIAMDDLICHKRQLVRINGIRCGDHGSVYEIDMPLVGNSFAEELVQANSGASAK